MPGNRRKNHTAPRRVWESNPLGAIIVVLAGDLPFTVADATGFEVAADGDLILRDVGRQVVLHLAPDDWEQVGRVAEVGEGTRRVYIPELRKGGCPHPREFST